MTLSGCTRSVRALDHDAIDAQLSTLHTAASNADGPTYWPLYAPDAVFLGTDASERWTLAEFKAYAEPFFSKGKGWTYLSTARNIDILDSTTAIFDESLTNAKYGTCRGSGVLRKNAGTWLIAQYNLSVPIPNDMLEGVAQQIHVFESSPRTPPANVH